jgi:hypothetical protein
VLLGLVILFLLVGLSSGSRLHLKARAGWYHIGGQDVELTLYRHVVVIVFQTELCFKVFAVFELCLLYSKPICKTSVVN